MKAAAQTIRKVYDIGWTPERYLFFGAASIAGTLKPAGLEKSKGLITAGYLKDPTVPSWQDDPGFKEWAAFATKYMSPTDVREGTAVYGFTTAATMVHVLEQCGDDLSRENILRQALAIKDLELPMLLPGVKINTSPDNYFLIRQMQLARFNGEMLGALWRIDQRLSRRKFTPFAPAHFAETALVALRTPAHGEIAPCGGLPRRYASIDNQATKRAVRVLRQPAKADAGEAEEPASPRSAAPEPRR